MDDKVLDERKVEELTRWLKIAMVGLVGITIVGTLYLFINRQSEKNEVAAYNLLFEAERFERDLGEGSNPFDPAFYQKMSEWSEEERSQYASALEKVVSEESDTQAAQLARLRLARLAFSQNDLAKAREHSQSAAELADEAWVKAQALHLLGTVEESSKNLEAASGFYGQAADLKGSPLRALSLLSEARVLSGLGKIEEASQKHQTVIDEFPESSYERQARALKLMNQARN